MKTLRFLLLAAVLVLSYTVSAAAAPVDCTKKIESFDFVVDYSGSMMMKNAKLKKAKIQVAKDVMHRINDAIPNQTFNGGLHTISPNGTLYAQGPWDRVSMHKAIDKLKSGFSVFGRMTYMGDSLNKYESFLSSMQRDAALILFSDGANNQGVDFVETARQIYASQRNLTIHVVSFADTPEGEANLKAIAAMNPQAQYVRAEDLATDDAALESFVIAVYCGKTETVIVLRGVNFAFDSYQLDAKAQGILDEAAELIKQNPGKNVVLTGWTDSKGSNAYNARLSQNRANSVKAYLAEQGVPGSRIKALGKGKSFKYDNSTEEGRYMNRRTEISFD
ncbi:MAG TPA: OmpA family protein [Candidatus Desulfovibrio intestinipullorum]|uniref:OmpA family protein n=1 Tax=Candidatus Desulfovibrio intestinipullorum TaxID=2838536 RepID=A0A9D1TPX1_9BACT|nr:OmpA family protein [Candidatus Desulfovibrio intestinipullorum]